VLREARQARQPDPENWWWFVDQLVANRRRDRVLRLLRLGAGAAVVLLLLFVLYQRFLAPDPATRERLIHQHNAENLALQQDVVGALSEVEQALAVAPDEPELVVLKGVLQRELGQDSASEGREDFLLARARASLLAGQPEAAVADAQEAVELNPQLAIGYVLMGRAHEQMAEHMEAIFAYEQAIDLAEEQGNYQLAGTTRISVGILMQGLQAQPVEGQ
jgi:tetratricopeptide (TPR) repeat protein